MRVMAYLALIHGALGLQYFARSPAEAFPNSPSAWNEVRHVALEVAELSPAIAGGHSRTSINADISGNGTWIEGAAWQATTEPGTKYTVVAVANLNNTPSVLTINDLSIVSRLDSSVMATYTGLAEVVGQNRNVTITNGVLHDMLLGYGTAAYRFPPVNWTGGGVVTGPNGILNPSFEYIANTGSPDGDYLVAPTDQLNGASFMADSRTSVDGAHSLRLIAPTAGGSYQGGPYPSSLINGTNYSLSVHAKAATEGVILDLHPSADLHMIGSTRVTLTTEWVKYELFGVAQTTAKVSVSTYALASAGTAWLDKLDVHQVNDCPTNGNSTNSTAGFSGLHLSPFDSSIPSAKALNSNSSGCCEAGWTGVDFQAICESHQKDGWFWWYPNTGPYLCCKMLQMGGLARVSS